MKRTADYVKAEDGSLKGRTACLHLLETISRSRLIDIDTSEKQDLFCGIQPENFTAILPNT